jgi:hypothetical protein
VLDAVVDRGASVDVAGHDHVVVELPLPAAPLRLVDRGASRVAAVGGGERFEEIERRRVEDRSGFPDFATAVVQTVTFVGEPESREMLNGGWVGSQCRGSAAQAKLRAFQMSS